MQQQETTENLFEIEDMMLPTDFPMRVDGPTSSPFPYKEVKDDKKLGYGLKSKRPERTSIGRPLRKAAEKVQSYKEVPLNVKTRRKDY